MQELSTVRADKQWDMRMIDATDIPADEISPGFPPGSERTPGAPGRGQSRSWMSSA